MSIHIQPSSYTIRVFGEHNTYDNEDAYIAVMSVNMLDDETAYIYAAKGSISRADFKEIHKALKGLGIKRYHMKRKGRLKTIVL